MRRERNLPKRSRWATMPFISRFVRIHREGPTSEHPHLWQAFLAEPCLQSTWSSSAFLPRSPRKQICSQAPAKSVRNAEDDQVDCKQGSARKACHKCGCSDVGPSRWIRTNLEMNGIVAQRDLFGRFRSRRIFFAAGAHEEYGICFNLCSIFQSYFSRAHML
jgi:hypothetical protein